MRYKQRAVKPLADRFWPKVNRSPTARDLRGENARSGCWLWTGATNGVGYGVIGLGRNAEGHDYAHRVSWRLHFGPIPEGSYVCHSCDNPGCVNPAHLFIGSNSDNVKDSVAKGRWNRQQGTERPMAKLTDDDVRAIRALAAEGFTTRWIAAKFGLDYGHVGRIIRREKWRHIT